LVYPAATEENEFGIPQFGLCWSLQVRNVVDSFTQKELTV